MSKAHTEDSQNEQGATPRVIGGLGSFALVAGSMLGIGVFIVPPVVAGHIQSEFTFIAVWLVAGFLAFAGAVACAELGTLIPRAGGDYAFQSKAYGKSVAFASGWVLFAAIFAGSIATMSVALCQYQLPVLGLDLTGMTVSIPLLGNIPALSLAAIGIVLTLTLINSVGALISSRVQTFLIAVPLVLLTLASAAVLGADTSVSYEEWVASMDALMAGGAVPVDTAGPVTTESSGLTMSSIVEAYVAVYFAYSGWNAVTYVAGEIKDPSKNIPRSLLSGTVVVTVVYLLLCIAFLAVLGMKGLESSGEAGTFTAGVIGGSTGKIIVTLLIAMALFAGLNGTVMGGARVAFAMGRSGAFISAVGKLSRGSKAPVRALWLQAFWACVLILTGSFEQLLTLTSLAMLVTGTLTVASVFVLRRTMPDVHRPYRAWGYPVVPALYVAASMTVIGYKVFEAFSEQPDSWYPLLGLVLLAVAFTAHQAWVMWSRKRRRRLLVGTVLVCLGASLIVDQLTRATGA